MTPSDKSEPGGGEPLDAHLRAALRHAPDRELQAPAALSRRIALQAREALQPARRPLGPLQRARAWLQASWSQPMAAGALGSLVLAGFIGLMWRDGLPPEALHSGERAAAPAEAAAERPVPMAAPVAAVAGAASSAPVTVAKAVLADSPAAANESPMRTVVPAALKPELRSAPAPAAAGQLSAAAPSVVRAPPAVEPARAPAAAPVVQAAVPTPTATAPAPVAIPAIDSALPPAVAAVDPSTLSAPVAAAESLPPTPVAPARARDLARAKLAPPAVAEGASTASVPAGLTATKAPAAPALARSRAEALPAELQQADPLAHAVAALAAGAADNPQLQAARDQLLRLQGAARGLWRPLSAAAAPIAGSEAVRDANGRELGRLWVQGRELVWQGPDGTWRARLP